MTSKRGLHPREGKSGTTGIPLLAYKRIRKSRGTAPSREGRLGGQPVLATQAACGDKNPFPPRPTALCGFNRRRREQKLWQNAGGGQRKERNEKTRSRGGSGRPGRGANGGIDREDCRETRRIWWLKGARIESGDWLVREQISLGGTGCTGILGRNIRFYSLMKGFLQIFIWDS